MTTDVTSGGRASTAAPSGRPYTVDYAVYAIVARCVFAILWTFALYGARNEIIGPWRADGRHAGWTETQFRNEFQTEIRDIIIQSLVLAVFILLIAKFIRDGKNWARWLFAILMVVPLTPAADVFRLTAIVPKRGLLVNMLNALAGLAALIAVVLLFLRPSAAYFRPAGVSPRVSPLAMLFRPKNLPPAKAAEQPSAPTVKKSQKPRAKSRKSAAE